MTSKPPNGSLRWLSARPGPVCSPSSEFCMSGCYDAHGFRLYIRTAGLGKWVLSGLACTVADAFYRAGILKPEAPKTIRPCPPARKALELKSLPRPKRAQGLRANTLKLHSSQRPAPVCGAQRKHPTP